MTTEELIKDLKEILGLMLVEGDLQRASTVSKTIGLINHQNAEIERLEAALNCYEETSGNKKAKAEAVKEFAERLKKIALQDGAFGYVDCYDINNLVKEFTEGKDD